MFPAATRKYLFAGLEGSPAVLSQLLAHLPADSPVWDHRPDPERFTLREMVAHLADWEPIWLHRYQRTVTEEKPLLPDIDEGQMAIDHDYAHANIHEALNRYIQGRTRLLAFLRAQPDTSWERVAHRETIGDLTLETMVAFALGHDGYHTHQAVQWLHAAR